MLLGGKALLGVVFWARYRGSFDSIFICNGVIFSHNNKSK